MATLTSITTRILPPRRHRGPKPDGRRPRFMNHLTLLPRLFLAGFAASLAAVPLMKRLAVRWGMVDLPAHRKSHLKPVPYLGGGAVFIGLLFSVLVAAWTAGSLPSRDLVL